MAEHSQTLQLLLGRVLAVFILSATASGQQTVVCGSSITSQPLSCTDTQWVRIVAEIYVPQTVPGSTCQQQNLSACNAYFYDTGMVANCNGPARRGGGGGACMEEVDVAAARLVTACLRDVGDVATIIQYKCIEGSSVLNLCDANVTMWTSNLPLYLASPGYVQLTPAGRLCTCHIQGSDLKMNAVEINVMSKLAWNDDAKDASSYSDMFSVSSGDRDLWRSSNCAGCTTTHLVNSNLFLPVGEGTRYPNVTVTYSDFGLPGQNVWVEIFESGPSISVSCRSTALPPDKVITVSTRDATTTPASTIGRPTPSNLPTTSQEHRTNVSHTQTVAAPITKVTTTRPTSPPSTSPPSTSASTLVYGKSTNTGNFISADQQDDSSGEVTLIVTLTVILCVLVLIGSVLAFLIYRKRHIFKSDDYISPWFLLVSWYHRMFQQKPPRGPRQDGCSHGNFDSVLMQAEPRQREPCETGSDVQSSLRPSAGNTEPAQNCQDISVANNSLLIPPEMYQYHQQLLDEELDKMRRERSSKKEANPVMTTSVPLHTSFSNGKSLDDNSLLEPDSLRRSVQQIQGPSSATTNIPVPTTKKLYSNTDNYMDRFDINDASSSINVDNRKNHSDTCSAETHRDDLDCLNTDEHRMFEALGINTHPHTHNVRGRHIGVKNSHDVIDYKQKKASTAEGDSIRKSRSQDGESSCKDNTFLEPVEVSPYKNDQSAPSHHRHGGKDSKPDIVSSIIQKCSQDIRHRRHEMNLPTTLNTSPSNTRSGEERQTGVQTSEC